MVHDNELLSYRELRRKLRCSQSTAEMLVRTGQMPSVQIGAPGSRRPRRMFRPADVEEFINKRHGGEAGQ
jgi:hypothetical protein